MKEILILRFGKNHPLPKEIPLIHAICGPELESAQGMPLGDVGTLSIVRTTWSPKEIADAFRELAEKTDDQLPVIVVELEQGGHHLADFKGFEQALKELRGQAVKPPTKTKAPAIQRCELDLDELLDIVSAKGMRGLNKQQRDRLKELSKK